MEPHAWGSDEEMGGDEIDVTMLIVESTQGDASKGLQVVPLEEDVRAVVEATIWRGKVRGLKENSSFCIPYHRDTHVWTFFRLVEENMDVHIQETQVMRCVICHPMPSSPSTSSPSATNTINKHKRRRSKSLAHSPHVDLVFACAASRLDLKVWWILSMAGVHQTFLLVCFSLM